MDPSLYQRARLWAGITSISTNLALIWSLAISASWWGASLVDPLSISLVFLAIAATITFANLPFDILSGDAVERAAHRIKKPTSSWLADWFRNRIWTASGLWTGMMFFSFSTRYFGPSMAGALVIAAVAIAILFILVPAGHVSPEGSSERNFEHHLSSELTTLGIKPRPVRWFDHGDCETVNGYITPNGTLSLSTTVAQFLTPREASLMAAREEYYRGSGTWILILMIVTCWTLFGVAVAKLLPSCNLVQAGLGGIAIMSSWSFLALFVWPTVNRIWMRNADVFLASLANPGEVRDLISKVERLNATDISLSPAKTAVFHPIPPLQDRLSNLERLP